VLLFASYADAFGARTIYVSLSTPCSGHALIDALRALPGGDRLPATPLLAVNRSWSELDHLVQPGDEVALIPPVAGG